MYTIDTSVWVNSFDQREPGHVINQRVLQLLAAQATPIYVPYLLLVEVAGAISRTRQDAIQAQVFVSALRHLPSVTFVALDEALAIHASTLAAQHGLRGADAVYAAVALQTGCILISLDNEHLTRLKSAVQVMTPQDALLGLTSSPSN